MGAMTQTTGKLPAWSRVLAVVAHPDDESFGLGGVLDAFARAGAEVHVLCLTHGEASTVHGVSGDLARLRAAELAGAAATLGITKAELRGHPDGALAGLPDGTLAREVAAALESASADGLVVFDPDGVTGHPDHAAATAAAIAAAGARDLPVLGWTLPSVVAAQLNRECGTAFVGHGPDEIDLVVEVSRERQRVASLAHASQAVPSSVLWRRLELLGDREHLRWLRRPAAAPAEDAAVMRVSYADGDRFVIDIRDHAVTVDQPVDIGGEDLGPTPTELFVASLASCVAFYARRYLRRHKLDATGLTVETSYRMGSKPARVAAVDLRIVLPGDLPDVRRSGLLAVAGHCTVHNTLTTPPAVHITLDGASGLPS